VSAPAPGDVRESPDARRHGPANNPGTTFAEPRHATTPRPARPDHFGLRVGAARSRGFRRRCRAVQDRLHPAHDRAICLHRQADRSRDQALDGAERRDGRRPQDRAGRERRRRRRRHHPAHRPGDGRQRQDRRAGRLRPDAARLRNGADRDAEQDADGRHRRGHLGHHRAVALHRAHQLHAAAGDGADRRLGGQARHQEGSDLRRRLRPRHRCREVLQEPVQAERRRSHRRDPHAAEEPRLRPSCRSWPISSPTRCSCFCPRARARRS